MHTLIVGARGVGKSTMIRRVLQEIDRPVFGFETCKEEDLADEVHGSPVYIYEAGQPHLQTQENLVGHCRDHHSQPDKAAFDRFAPKLSVPVDAGSIIVLDELGFMESGAETFCAAVMSLLDGPIPVIAAVKDKDTPFLMAVRAHHNCRCFFIDEENRDELYSAVVEFVQQQMGG
ncbi:MAG: nucleoside-triphosphatase [Syntrophomonadaceae bacterium]|nr:nucleoside-triphosphatase [Syntrophomonadaceae bacterium]